MHGRLITAVSVLVLLCACAQQPRPADTGVSVMVVPSSSDGHVGSVVVRPLAGEGRVVLNKPYVSAGIDEKGGVHTTQADAKTANREFADARAALPPAPVTVLVFFVEGTDTLQPNAKRSIDRVADEIAKRDAPEVTVIGHTDFVGSDEYNDRLSLQRAEKVRDQLVRRGIASSIIQLAGRGKREPIVDTTSAELQNRRVEITVR